jgi:hypothetical protein
MDDALAGYGTVDVVDCAFDGNGVLDLLVAVGRDLGLCCMCWSCGLEFDEARVRDGKGVLDLVVFTGSGLGVV